MLWSLLGDLPARDRPISARLIDAGEHDGYWLERLELDLNGCEPVPAYFARPLGVTGPLPTVLYHHCHGGRYAIGKDELISGHAGVLLDEPYARALTRQGQAVLCIDAWCFGERSHTHEHDTVKAMLWRGQVLWGMMIYDAVRSLDYLHSRADVDSARIGTAGISMGSLMAWWLAALDSRVKACAEMCCLVDYETLLANRALGQHNFYFYVPGLLKHFNTPDILALIAPRAHLACVGEDDPKVPLAGVQRIDTAMRQRYAELGAPQAWQVHREASGHVETPAMRERVLAFLAEHLQPASAGHAGSVLPLNTGNR